MGISYHNIYLSKQQISLWHEQTNPSDQGGCRAIRYSPGTKSRVTPRRPTSFRWSLPAACCTSAFDAGRCRCYRCHKGKINNRNRIQITTGVTMSTSSLDYEYPAGKAIHNNSFTPY